MSLNSLPLNNSALYTVPKLAADGSNWLTYKERTLTVMGTRGLMRHLNGTARHPPTPPAWPRPSPSVSTPTITVTPPVVPASASASSAGQTAASSASTAPSTTTGAQTQGTGPAPSASTSTTTSATAGQQQSVSGTGTTTTTVVPQSDPYANLSDEDYFKKVEDAEAKVDEFEQREFATRQQIYSTISDTMLIRVKNLPSAAMVWTALVTEYEGKSEMYSNVIRTRLLNTKCPEGGNLREHLDTLWHLREQLASMGATLPDQEFSATIYQSVPESYGYLLTSLSTAARISRNLITPIDIIQALNEEYDRRTAQAPSSDSALAAYQPGKQRKDVECFNCHKKGHVKSDCWRKGGGKEGQGPRDQMPKRNKRGGRGGASANAATESTEHAFAITVDSAALASTTPGGTKVEIFDSGATRHISPYRDEFVTYKALEPARPISAADGHTFMAVGEGQVRMRLPNGDSSTVVTLEQVLHAPGIAFSLISIPQADRAGYSAVFENGECRLYLRSSGETVGRIPSVNGLYQVRRPEVAAAAVVGRGAETEVSVLEFHRRMGHISPAVAKRMVEEGRVLGVKLTGGSTEETCDVCIQAKITRVPIPKERSSDLAKHYGECFHADTWAANCTSIGGNKYAVMFTDDHTRWTHTTPEKEKNQAFPAYKALDAEVETQEGRKIKVLHTDGGGEFCSNEFGNYIKERGGHHEKTPHDTPEGNGVSERANRTLAEHSRAMLIDSGLPQYLWSYALLHATWLKNRTSTRALDGKTPYEARYGTQPDLRGLKPFGAKCWVRLEHAPKMQPKAVEGRFVGYAVNEHGYYIYWPGRNKVSVERNVRFTVEPEPQVAAEDVQPEGARKEVSPPASSAPEMSPAMPSSPEPTPAASEPAKPTETPQNVENVPQADVPPAIPPATAPSSSLPPSPPHPSATVEDAPNEDAEEPELLGRGHRVKRPSATLRRIAAGEGTVDGHRGGASKLPRGLQPESLMGAAAIAELEEPWIDPEMPELEIVDRDPPESLPEREDELVSAYAIQAGQDPRTLEEARQSPDWPQWQRAIDAEYDNLRRHDVFDLVEPPPDANIVGSKLVFRVKHDAEGAVSGFKARLVAQGFSQVPGRDYHDDETFAPVSRLPSIRTILSLAARHDWELRQMDVKSAYLNGILEETVYMRLPPGFAPPEQSHLVCRLKKTLYGLKQAGRGWYKTLTAAMENMGFTRCVADHAVFYKREGESAIIVAASVDDLTITGTSDLVDAFAVDIKQRFEMSDLGDLHWILGIEVRRDRQARTIAISQRSYIDTIVSRFNLDEAAPLSIPLQPGSPLGNHQSPSTPRQFEDMRDVPYREAVGSLMYAAMGTRPDITFAVTALSQFMQNPGRAHWDALKRVLRYLKGSRELWLVYGTNNEGLRGYSDADWGSSTEHRHSISGYVFTLDGGAISWSSKKQNVVALSSTEAEYIALTHATKEAIWLRYVLSDILHPELATFPVRLHSDNRSAIALAKDNAFHSRTKHIDIRFHFIREAVDNRDIVLEHRRTEDMPADLFTKALPRAKLEHLSRLFGLRSL
ncbi:transcription factor [Ganoderma sinense ZZ0214-1]|uniref:Transcription factor n=1 Tax=Ganoderma sinense ZZ0214-1 TaxID=1077348 RepID=A0A2G8RWY5_9APHY|nr:transcription factor [Ganoderma sinense ZZ0214-1]